MDQAESEKNGEKLLFMLAINCLMFLFTLCLDARCNVCPIIHSKSKDEREVRSGSESERGEAGGRRGRGERERE